MHKNALWIFLLQACFSYASLAQRKESLRQQLEGVLLNKNADVGVMIMDATGKDTLSIRGDHHFPMQSVFKFHIALKMLSEIDQGKFSLDQKITIHTSELLPGLYSPLRERYPHGGTLPISEILKFTVSKSDNVGCDVLLRLLGGPKAVESFFKRNGFQDLSIEINEEVMQNNWDLQFLNWTTPKAATEVLFYFYYNKKEVLSKKSHAFFWSMMKETETGKNRLKGLLPPGTVAAHKTGWSGANGEGLTAAVNDVGVIFLPNGKPFFISVFVTNSKEEDTVNERIIAEIAKAVWDYFLQKRE